VSAGGRGAAPSCRRACRSLTQMAGPDLTHAPAGKYLAPGGGPPEARLNRYRGRYAEAESRYGPKPNVAEAVAAYAALAAEWGLSPAALALRFVLSRPAVAAAVIGATGPGQLGELLDAAAAPPLAPALLEAVDAIHRRYPSPTP